MARHRVGHHNGRSLILLLLGAAAAAWWTQARQQPAIDAETARRLRVGGAR